MKEETIVIDGKKEAGMIGRAKVYESVVPQYDIFLPDMVIRTLGVTEHDSINFIEEAGKVYLEKA